ncbi:AarF/ABC1/UbiB kinase family protein [Janthinobacterium sp. SUN137]|uniref:ABC1 kinase family protein n=1 Tax=Janthinobacterium sp. SUN137 TaxID=3014789 RepID=UPI002713A00F|nr:AarF/ABC1/UbiB kinase family protein [Janthinobacterium sp. SUN137]MDO8039581.1 AarF/ABC1/UbiB kinase family protein [Janthinobacterium sp. SUN137]
MTPTTKTNTVSRLPRTGRLSRGAIVGMAVARAGLTHLGHKAKSITCDEAKMDQARMAHEAELGRILFAALNQLKGTALKASQLLSMELGFLPEGVRQELARAHYQVTPLNRALVIKVMRQEFGQDPQALFQQFEPVAFAAASLGQVHAAIMADGLAVAVKLQYPGMADSIGSDMRMLRSLLQALGERSDMLLKADIIARMMDDIEQKLAEELDYLHEAQTMQWFAQHLTLPGLVVPQPVMGRTTRRVLTMQRLPGLHLNEWLLTEPDQNARDQAGQLLFDTFFHCTFVLHCLQADPHPGNYLFMPDGRLGLLDFGCTRALDADFCQALSALWSAQLRDPADHRAMQQAYRDLGLIGPHLNEQDFCQLLLPAMAERHAWQKLPFTVEVYDFTHHPPYPRPSAEHHRQALRHLQSLPEELPYVDRAYLGLIQLLKTLGARVRTTNPWIR